MLVIKTERLVGVSNMEIQGGKLVSIKREVNEINIFDLKPISGKESAFIFYDIHNTDIEICHIGITWKRNRFEVSYGTNEVYRRKGFLQEALSAFIEWVVSNTDEKEIWGLPNGPESEHILMKCGFIYYDVVENSNSKWYRFDCTLEGKHVLQA